MKKFNHFSIILLIFLQLVSACKKGEETISTSSGPDLKTLKKQYNLAVLDARVAEPWEISKNLVAVVNYGDSMAGQGNLVWSPDSHGKLRVLVVSWMKGTTTQFWPVDSTIKTNSNQDYMSWITTDPEMLDFLKKESYTDSSKLHLRIAQVLGMPPDTKNNFFVEFWVYPENLFRPSPDPEITDHEADLYFPAWASQKHKAWFINEMQTKYDTGTSTAFPWTRLGYTYDWANPQHPVGLSEFVVDTSSWVTVKGIYSTWQYYQKSLTKK